MVRVLSSFLNRIVGSCAFCPFAGEQGVTGQADADHVDFSKQREAVRARMRCMARDSQPRFALFVKQAVRRWGDNIPLCRQDLNKSFEEYFEHVVVPCLYEMKATFHDPHPSFHPYSLAQVYGCATFEIFLQVVVRAEFEDVLLPFCEVELQARLGVRRVQRSGSVAAGAQPSRG
mmetsp:Transcript_27918/g.70024  ORF Transcript_27918/g.70024 Transcript_27918/m.70024 type:complete len:175 (-) Transcript_27918:504-1028(-)